MYHVSTWTRIKMFKFLTCESRRRGPNSVQEKRRKYPVLVHVVTVVQRPAVGELVQQHYPRGSPLFHMNT